jgi:hypothetical protein
MREIKSFPVRKKKSAIIHWFVLKILDEIKNIQIKYPGEEKIKG